ncbi:MAG: hypothetical protein LBS81_03250 [Endomicrobium sp.]|nr:hypothetical protein [Endomicrobium sp.]
MQNKLQEEIKIITKRAAHDIRSPLTTLSMLTQYCQNLSEKERSILKNIASNIENIANDLLEKYKITDNIKIILIKHYRIFVLIWIYAMFSAAKDINIKQ